MVKTSYMEKRRNQISHLWVKKDTKAFSLPLFARSNIMVEKGPNDVLACFCFASFSEKRA